MQLVFVHLTTEQAAEYAQSDAVRLVRVGLGAHIIIELAEEDGRHNQCNEQCHHVDDILVGTGADGNVNKLFAEPYHDKSQHHLCDAHYDAYQGVPPDARHVTENPEDVGHGSGCQLLAIILRFLSLATG